MKLFLSLFITALIFSSCKKDDEFKIQNDFYFQMKVNGHLQKFGMCGGFPGGTGGGQFECSLRDTTLFIVAGCNGYTGFLINGNINDGVYSLNAKNIGWVSTSYSNDYQTNSLYTGTLAIKKVLFKNRNSLQGTFSYKAIDTISHEIATITQGNFIMPIGN